MSVNAGGSQQEPQAVDASTSNAGDDFHMLWAANKSLTLLSPGAELVAIKPEGLAPSDAAEVDPTGDALLSVDLAEYFGGSTFTDANEVVYSQLKYSTRRSNANWTLAEVTRGKKPSTSVGSLIRGLAKVFLSHKKKFGETAVLGKLRLLLVSNRPLAEDLLVVLSKATRVLDSGEVNITAGLLKALEVQERTTIEQLKNASSLGSRDFCSFLRVLDLSSHTDESSRLRLEIDVAKRLGTLGFADTLQQVDRLKGRIWQLMQPESRGLVTRDEVLALLGTTYEELFPAPNRIKLPNRLIDRRQAAEIAAKIVQSPAGALIVHGDGGCGKTTLLAQLGQELPRHSICVVFDCFADGAYKNPEDRRHRHEYGLTQIHNELALASLTSFSLDRSGSDTDRLRQFLKKLQEAAAAAQARNDQAVVCVCIDAADNSVAAAEAHQEKSYPNDLLKADIPDGCRVVLSCRTHRLHTLTDDPDVPAVKVRPFCEQETKAKIESYFPDATTTDVEEFLELTGGNPRVQDYFLSQSDNGVKEALESLRPDGKHLDGLFDDAVVEAKLRNGDDAIVDRTCTALVALPRPVPVEYLAKAAGIGRDAIQDVLADLTRGVFESGGNVGLRDEDLECYLEGRFAPDAAFRKHWAEICEADSDDRTYAATHLGRALEDAGQFDRLVVAIDDRRGLTAVPDPIERRRVQISRIWSALRCENAEQLSPTSLRLLFLLASESKSGDAIETLLAAHPEVTLRYASLRRVQQLFSHHYPEMPGSNASRHMAASLVLSLNKVTHPAARERRDLANACVREYFDREKNRKEELGFPHDQIDGDSFASQIESLVRTDGQGAARDWIKGFGPRGFRTEVCRKAARGYFARSRSVNLEGHEVPTERDALLAVIEAAVGTSSTFSDAWLDAVERFLPSLVGYFKHRRSAQMTAMTVSAAEACASRVSERADWIELLRRCTSHPPTRAPEYYRSQKDFDVVDTFLRGVALESVLCNQALSAEDPRLLPADLVDSLKTEQQRADADQRERDQLERDRKRREDLQSFYRHMLPAYLFRAHGFSKRNNVEERKRLLDEALAVGSGRRLTLRDKHKQWIRPRLTLIARTIAATSVSPATEIDLVLAAQADRWPELSLDVAEQICRTPNLDLQTTKLITEAADRVREALMPGEEKTQLLMRCCELTSLFDKRSAQLYFDEAVEAAREVDDEAFSLLEGLSSLAMRASKDDANDEAVDLAERLACVVEDFSIRFDGWGHFPWSPAFAGMTRLSAGVGAVVACRWDQSGRLSISQSLPYVIQHFGSSNATDYGLPFASFLLPNSTDLDGLQEALRFVDRMQGQADTNATAALEELVDFATRKAEFSERPSASRALLEWADRKEHLLGSVFQPVKKLADFLNSLDEVEDDGVRQPSIVEVIGAETRQEDLPLELSIEGRFVEAAEIESVLKQVVRGSEKKPWLVYSERRKALEKIQTQVQVSDSSLYLRALLEVDEGLLPLHDRLHTLSKALERWRSVASVEALLEEIAGCVAERFACDFFGEREYPVYGDSEFGGRLPFKAGSFALQVLRALTSSPDQPDLSAHAVYQFAAVLAGELRPSDARTLLGEILDSSKAGRNDGLVATGAATAAQQVQERSVGAGLMWYLLAHPSLGVRWTAAHAMRSLCRIGLSVLADTVPWLSDGQSHPYCLPTKAFYWLAGRQWFFMLVERLAHEKPQAIMPHQGLISQEIAASPYPHAIVLAFCQRAIATLAEHDQSVFSDVELTNADGCLSGTLAKYDEDKGWTPSRWSEGGEEKKAYPFDHDRLDTERYWFKRLAEVFDLSRDEFLTFFNDLVHGQWGLGAASMARDCTRSMFKGQSYQLFCNHHGSAPRVERFETHLELHGMLCSSMRMLEQCTIQQDRYSEEQNGWLSWLSRWDLSKPGQWLSDHRIPAPHERRFWEAPDPDYYRAALTDADFHRAMGLVDAIHPEHVVVWGGVDSWCRRNSRDANVYSALVSPASAYALMRALQQTDPWDFRLPDEGDAEMEFEDAVGGVPFLLSGWIRDTRIETSNLEESDPYALRMTPSQLGPGSQATEYFDLQPSSLDSEFVSAANGSKVALRESWHDGPAAVENERYAFWTSGTRLWFRRRDLLDFLTSVERSLVVEVQISRSVDDDELESPTAPERTGKQHDRQSRIYVVDHSGTVTSVDRDNRPWQTTLC